MNGLLHLLVPLALGLSADQYARTRVDPGSSATLAASQLPCLWWATSEIVYSQSDLGNPATGPSAFDGVTRAWMSWQAVNDACGSLKLSEGPRLSERAIGYDPSSSSNTNLILFRTRSCSSVVPSNDPCRTSGDCNNKYDCWAYNLDVIALTTTHYKTRTGEIVDADVELNSVNPGPFVFTTVDSPPCIGVQMQSCVAYDIQNTMTHEFGHSLGLDHTSYLGSIMNPTASVGETSKRTIDPGSKRFICDNYPRALPPRDCHLQLQGTHQQLFGCTAAEGSSGGAVCLLAALRLWRRRAARLRRLEQSCQAIRLLACAQASDHGQRS